MRTGQRRAVVARGFEGFELGDGLLEDTAERIECDGLAARGGAEIIVDGEVEQVLARRAERLLIGVLAGGKEDAIWYGELVKLRIRLEEATVETLQRAAVEDATLVHAAEEPADNVPSIVAVRV